MDPQLALIAAGCALVPAALAFFLRRRGLMLATGVLIAALALAGLALVLAASRTGGMDGLGYVVLAIGAFLATGGAILGLIAGAIWRRR
jgi:hypothetical protein